MIVIKIVIKNYLLTSQAPLPKLMLFEKLVDNTSRKAIHGLHQHKPAVWS